MTTKEQNTQIAITLILFIYTLSVFFPGSYRNDTWAQYYHAINHNYGDWFEPALSFLWNILLALTGNFVSLYVFQMMIFWIFVTILTWDLKIKSIQFWLATCLSTFFVVIAQYVMRDSELAICWGLAVVLLFRLPNVTKKYYYILIAISFILLWFGFWVRSNSIIALIPLLLAFLRSIFHTRAVSYKKIFLLSIFSAMLLLAGTRFLNYKILNTYNEYPAYKLKLSDITGISKLSGENLLPNSIKMYPKFNFERLIQIYSPASFDHIYWPIDSTADLIPFPTAQLNYDAGKSWFAAIKKHPFLYLKNRMDGFLFYLRIYKRFEKEEYWNVPIFIESDNSLNIVSLPNPVREGFNIMYHKFNKTFFYDPWFWLLLNCVGFIIFFLKHKKNADIFIEMNIYVQLSGVTYTLSQFFVYQFDRDFRYSYWNVMVALIGFCTILNNNYLKNPCKKIMNW